MDAGAGRVAVRLFGPLELTIAGRTLHARAWGGVKPRHLLEILLLDRGRTVPKDRLADLLWGEELPQRANATIEAYVSVLRQRLDVTPGRGRRCIVTEHGGYRIASADVDVDVDRFDELLRQAAHGQYPAQRRATLEQAIALATDDLLGDEGDQFWIVAPRAHYRELRHRALLELAELCLQLRDCSAALVAAERVLADEPTSERAYRVIMLAHYAAGDRAAALTTHTRCRRELDEAFGVPPDRNTAAVHVAIVRGEPATTLLGPQARPDRYPIRFAASRGARIAYQVVGDGPVDLVFVPSFVSNLGSTWDDATYASFLGRLATMGRLILFDKRGTGLSDPALDFPTTRERSDDLLGVLDAAGSRKAVLFGSCAGGALCAHFAADHPQRLAGLVLFGAFARLLQTTDYAYGWPKEKYDRFLAAFEESWLSGGDPGRRNPGISDDPRYREWFTRFVRLAANPFMARRLAEMNADIDVRPLLASITAPTLVIVRSDDVWLSAENSRYLAQHIPGSRLLELPGLDHDPWVGDTEPLLQVVEDFVQAVAVPQKT